MSEFNDDGELVGLVEKPENPPSSTVITGAFAFDPLIFDACRVITPSARGEYVLPAAVDLLLYSGQEITLVEAYGFHIDVNDESDVAEAESYLNQLK